MSKTMLEVFQEGCQRLLIHENGQIERIANDGHRVAPSPSWTCTGAVLYNNFGKVVQRYTLAEIMRKELAWKHKNGQQRIFITDNDHGTAREWRSPAYSVVRSSTPEREPCDLEEEMMREPGRTVTAKIAAKVQVKLPDDVKDTNWLVCEIQMAIDRSLTKMLPATSRGAQDGYQVGDTEVEVTIDGEDDD